MEAVQQAFHGLITTNQLAIVRRRFEKQKPDLKKQTSTPAPRGEQPYCTYRRGRGYKYYRPSRRGDQDCQCGRRHLAVRPKEWATTPAEIAEWDYNLPDGGHKKRKTKVRFAEPVVTKVTEFQKWFTAEYEFSDRYWSKGPVRMSEDMSTEGEDEMEIRWLEEKEKMDERKSGKTVWRTMDLCGSTIVYKGW